MHREMAIVVRRIDEVCDPIANKFLLSLAHGDGGEATAPSTMTDGRQFSLYGFNWSAGAFYGGELRGIIGISDATCGKGAKVFIFVDPAWRRKGIALALIEAAKVWAVDQQMHNLTVSCARSDWPTRNLLEKIGARLDLIFGEIVADVPLHQTKALLRPTSPLLAADVP